MEDRIEINGQMYVREEQAAPPLKVGDFVQIADCKQELQYVQIYPRQIGCVIKVGRTQLNEISTAKVNFGTATFCFFIKGDKCLTTTPAISLLTKIS
mgnify:CR=1 FL=1